MSVSIQSNQPPTSRYSFPIPTRDEIITRRISEPCILKPEMAQIMELSSTTYTRRLAVLWWYNYMKRQNLLKGHFCHPNTFIDSIFGVHYQIYRRPDGSFSVATDKALVCLLDQFIDQTQQVTMTPEVTLYLRSKAEELL